MYTERSARPKWQLSDEAFNGMLDSLAADRDQAGEAYLHLRQNLVRFFEIRGFSSADDHADEVLDRLARKLESGEQIENASTYALGIARMVTLELRKSPETKLTHEFPDIAARDTLADDDGTERQLACADKCLDELPFANRELVLRYYSGRTSEKIENRKRLSEELGIAQHALRNRMARLREKLESCISACLRKRK